MASQSLLEQALELPEKERFRLVEALLTSLSSALEAGEEAHAQQEDPELSAELQRRGAELSANPDAALSWHEVQDLAKAELEKLGQGPCP